MSESKSLSHNKAMEPAIWKLRSKADYRFQGGHPWIYSNELDSSPKGVSPGQPITLKSHDDRFLASGYGNPHSLICFRALTRIKTENPWSTEFWKLRLNHARTSKKLAGKTHSFRWLHAEADGAPGLVLDYYETPLGPVCALQCNTAGAESLLPILINALQQIVENPCFVIHRQAGVRKLEGLELLEPELISTHLSKVQLSKISVRTTDNLSLVCDLIDGQKTGLFLDQVDNIQGFLNVIEPWAKNRQLHAPQAVIRILDLCCYVGQWGTAVAQSLQKLGIKLEVTGLDMSEKALKTAEQNVRGLGVDFKAVQGDIMQKLKELPSDSFDVVICDPPALIKNKKDIPAGSKGYLKINQESLRLLKGDGWIVSCSCSGLLDEWAFSEILGQAANRLNRSAEDGSSPSSIHWVSRGGFSIDHPRLAEFPEGHYLKVWIGRKLSI